MLKDLIHSWKEIRYTRCFIVPRKYELRCPMKDKGGGLFTVDGALFDKLKAKLIPLPDPSASWKDF